MKIGKRCSSLDRCKEQLNSYAENAADDTNRLTVAASDCLHASITPLLTTVTSLNRLTYASIYFNVDHSSLKHLQGNKGNLRHFVVGCKPTSASLNR